MKLSKATPNLTFTANLPEKVLQFGTGVLLRGLCDYLIDKANRQGSFNGSIVVVKSTGSDVSEFTQQDNLYTIGIRGIDKGLPVEENYVCSSISRVLSAVTHWNTILETAKSADMQVVVSNTTEVGLSYVEEIIEADKTPTSYIAKLTAWLKVRFEAGLDGVVIIPTELLVDNGKIVKEAVLKLAEFNKLDKAFIRWIDEKNHFCSSLVDRIVPGKPKGEALKAITEELGYEDGLLTMAEVYRLWAIEGNNKVKELLSFEEADKGVVVEKDIAKYRELKLRLLNGTHTLMSGLSYLSGYTFVKDVMNDELMEKYITILMLTELAPAIPYPIDAKVSQRYGREVMDRFRNPSLDHQWISITLQYTMKMRMRCIPLLLNYYEVFETVPQYFARCFAAYLLFMKATKVENGTYYGENEGIAYPIQCDSAGYFYEVWASNTASDVVTKVLSNTELWGANLSELRDFRKNVETHLSNMQLIGVKEVASALNVYA